HLNNIDQPADCSCSLTNEHYSHIIAELWQARVTNEYEHDDIMLLKVGRHLLTRPNFKLIVGRDEGENNFLQGYRKRYKHLHATSHSGPLVLLDVSGHDDDGLSGEDLWLAARLTARFGHGRDAESVAVSVTDLAGRR